MGKEQIPKVSVTPSFSFLYASIVEIEPPLLVGEGPYGERRIINITGGAFAGPRLSGRVLPGGADWQIIRKDGIAELTARYTLKTNDGALIYITNWGLRHGPKDVMERLAGKLERELKPGARVVSCNFGLPGWNPERILRPDSLRHSDPIYIYRYPQDHDG